MTDEIRRQVLEIQARAKRATKGPWRGNNSTWALVDSDEEVIAHDIKYVKDNQFIAHSRADIPWLCEEILKLLAEKEKS